MHHPGRGICKNSRLFSLTRQSAPVAGKAVHRQSRLGLPIALTLLWLPMYSAYAVNTLMSEDDYLTEMPTILTTSRLSQPIADAPAAVTVIDRDTIRDAGIIDLAEIFRLVPGFYVGANAGYQQNTNSVVSYHGMTDAFSRRMQVLIDGRSIYQPIHGGVQWSEIPLAISDIERIEVTRGPNAASYGANAFLGVINIITQHSSQVNGSSVSLTHGSGRNEAFYRYGGKLDALTYRVTAGYREDDGLQNRFDFKRTNMLSVRADYQANNRDNIEFQFGYSGGDRQEGNPEADALVFLPRTKDISTHFEMVHWRRSLQAGSEFSLQAYHAVDNSRDRVTTTDLSGLLPGLASPRVSFNNNVESERFDIEAQHTFTPLPSLRMVWGGSLRQDRTRAPFYMGVDRTDYFDLQRLFTQLEWRPWQRTVFNAGAMVEHNDFTGTDISPRVSVNLRIADGHTLRLGVSSATRTPSYLEEKFQARLIVPSASPPLAYTRQYFLDGGHLDPERIVSREIGYLAMVGSLSLDARLYYDTISDLIRQEGVDNFQPAPNLIVPPGLPKPYNYINIGDSSARGFETQLQWRIASDTRLIANYAHIHLFGDEDILQRNFLKSAPTNSISALLSHRFNPDWNGSLAYYQSSATAMLGDGNPVGLARHWDARVARSLKLGRYQGELALIVQNLTDEHYQEFADYNTLRRRAYATVRLDF